jgi:hypothetical protein
MTNSKHEKKRDRNSQETGIVMSRQEKKKDTNSILLMQKNKKSKNLGETIQYIIS